ncbi:MAG: hypothetical protein GY711_05630 [bacterium]|nr:hypothetical protein [bacterium]
MTMHDPGHEEALDEILGTELDARGAFRASRLAGCPRCAALVEEVLAMEERLAGAGQVERENVSALAESDVPAGRAERALRMHVDSLAGPPGPTGGAADRRRRVLFVTLLAATAAAVVLFWSRAALGPEQADPEIPDRTMGAADVELVHPVGPVERYAPFEWAATRPGSGWFLVEVFADEDGRPGTRLDVSDRLEATRWAPAAAEAAAWPDRILWTLQVFSGADAVDAEGPFTARARRAR